MTQVIRFLSALFGTLAPATVLAAVPNAPCNGLIGCGGGPANVLLDALPEVGSLMIMIASGSAVFFIAFAGLQMVLALGNDGQIGTQKWAIMYVLLGLGIAILSQLAVSLAGTEPRLDAITSNNLPLDLIAAGVGIILTIFNAAFAVAIVIGGIRMVYAQGKSDEFNAGRKIVIWSAVGAVVANLANALVQALAAIFGV
jgi:hypothetical protein